LLRRQRHWGVKLLKRTCERIRRKTLGCHIFKDQSADGLEIGGSGAAAVAHFEVYTNHECRPCPQRSRGVA
jgi:hypothetical protein